MVPFDDKSPFITSGIRIGTAAITSRGMKENHMNQIVDWIDSILMNADDEANTLRVKNEVNEFMKQFPLY
jgi:glycine hydroxymethyltransferase